MEEADDEGSDHAAATPRTTTKRKRNAIPFVKSTKTRLSDDDETVGSAGSTLGRKVPVKKKSRRVDSARGPAASAHDTAVPEKNFDHGLSHALDNILSRGGSPRGNTSENKSGSTGKNVASENERVMEDLRAKNMSSLESGSFKHEAEKPELELGPLPGGDFRSEAEKIQWKKAKAAFLAQRPLGLCPSIPPPLIGTPEIYPGARDFSYGVKRHLHTTHPLLSGQPAIDYGDEKEE